MSKTIIKSQDKIDNRNHLMDLIGMEIIDNKVEFKPTDEIINIVDTETTGKTDADRIVQFSGIKYKVENGVLKKISDFDTYIYQPTYDENKKLEKTKWQDQITLGELTGITNEMLKTAPSESEAFIKIKEFFGDNPTFVAFNTRFDYQKVVDMHIRNGENFIIPEERKLDVLVMAKDLIPEEDAPVFLDQNNEPVIYKNGKKKKTWKLSYLTKHFHLDKAEDGKELSFHNSLIDVMATGRLLNLFISKYKTQIENEIKQDLKKDKFVRYRAEIRSIRYWPGFRGYARFYINAYLNSELVSYYYDIRRKQWGEKQDNVLERTLIDDLKKDVLELANVEDEIQFGKLKIKEDKPIIATNEFLKRYR